MDAVVTPPAPPRPLSLCANTLQFVHGQREGAGRFTAKSGLVYVGEWRAGRMTGVGQSTDVDGTGKCFSLECGGRVGDEGGKVAARSC